MFPISRRWLIVPTLLLLLLSIASCSTSGSRDAGVDPTPDERERPNVLLILADDAGWGDFGFMGAADLETPHLDALAADGTVFTQAYVSASVCSPSRAGLLTGRYQQRFGHECNLAPHPEAFDSSQVTIAEALRAEGYHTAIFGKWHLGQAPHQHPLENGFDHFYGFIAGSRSYFPYDYTTKEYDTRTLVNDYEPQEWTGYMTDELGDAAVRYVTERGRDSLPFFAYLAFNAPHTPMEAKEEDLARYPDHPRPVYAAMVYAMDRAIGRVVEALKASGDYENTLIVFLSDNGGAHNNNSSVGPLKGWKGNQFEGGIRVPFLVTWPGHTPAGATHTGMISSLDIYATAMDAAGSSPAAALDGVSLLPLLGADDRTANAHELLFWRKDLMSTVRHGSHKLIHLDDFGEVVYGTAADGMVDETNDLDAPEDQPLRDSLIDELARWESELRPPLWTEGAAWNEVTGYAYRMMMTNQPVLAKDPRSMKNLKSK